MSHRTDHQAFLASWRDRLDRTQLTALEALASRGGSMSADALAAVLGIPAFRINGFISILQEKLHSDGDELLMYDPTDREVRLELGRALGGPSRVAPAPAPQRLDAERTDEMSIQSPLESLVEFAENHDPRAPCVLVLDTSGSMEGDPIHELSDGLRKFKQAVSRDVLASRRVEPAIVTFDDDARVLVPFTVADQFEPPTLETGGRTRMARAILLALELLENRKALYKKAGVPYYRPFFILMTDGSPTDPEEIDAARTALRQAEAAKKVFPTIIGIGGANMEFLKTLSARSPVRMKDHAFEEFFLWLSGSLQRVSASQVGDGVRIDAPSDWGYIEP